VGIAQSIWVVPVGGGAPRQVVEDGTYGSWSPDGRRIAYSAGDQITVADIDGSGALAITTKGGTAPQWSPDGKRIAFTSFRAGRGQIFVIDADGRNERRLEADDVPGKAGFATWSPDGTRIAFASTRHTSCPPDGSDLCPQRIYTIRADGTGVRVVASDAVTDQLPGYFPLGTR
jgi:Tol biopolymer transport system component